MTYNLYQRMHTEDDTFQKLRKPTFGEIYAILEKRSNEPAISILEFYGWDVREFTKQMADAYIKGKI